MFKITVLIVVIILSVVYAETLAKQFHNVAIATQLGEEA